jgi:hypothetical protein
MSKEHKDSQNPKPVDPLRKALPSFEGMVTLKSSARRPLPKRGTLAIVAERDRLMKLKWDR